MTNSVNQEMSASLIQKSSATLIQESSSSPHMMLSVLSSTTVEDCFFYSSQMVPNGCNGYKWLQNGYLIGYISMVGETTCQLQQ